MSGKEQFVKLPREVLESAALRALGINGWRVMHFLMLEHLRRGGHHNGKLKAPRRQLWEFGVGQHFVSSAIAEAETLGLIDVARGNRRVASTYALTWMPLHDGAVPSNRWRECDSIAMAIISGRKEAKTRPGLSAKQHSGVSAKQHSKDPLMSAKQHSKPPETMSAKQHSLYRSSYHGEARLKEVEGDGVQPLGAGAAVDEGERPPDDGQPVRQPSANIGPPCPYRGCGKPIGLCEHTRRPIPATPSSGKPNGSTAP
jgi:hypothetical protein